MSWAIAAYDHAETHFNILCVVPDVRRLRLTPIDDRIYQAFCKQFPELKIGHLTEEDIKSDEQKKVRSRLFYFTTAPTLGVMHTWYKVVGSTVWM